MKVKKIKLKLAFIVPLLCNVYENYKTVLLPNFQLELKNKVRLKISFETYCKVQWYRSK